LFFVWKTKMILATFLAFLVFGSNAIDENENAKLRRTNEALMEALRAISEEVTVGQNVETTVFPKEEVEGGGSDWFITNGYPWSDHNVYKDECKWFGTAPFCEPGDRYSCPGSSTMVWMKNTKAGLTPGPIQDKFGSSCWSGDKLLCCRYLPGTPTRPPIDPDNHPFILGR
jgi:hypothetical protein